MPHTDYLRLIDRGRKAGLGTLELYQAMGARRPEASDPPSQTDGNGVVSTLGPNGERIFRPMHEQST